MTHPTTEDNSVLVMMLSLLFPRFQQIRSNFGGLLFALAKSTYFSSSALRVPHNFDLGDELKGVGRGGGGRILFNTMGGTRQKGPLQFLREKSNL